MHLFFVALMAFAGLPKIVIYTSLLWGFCCYMSIPLTEEEVYLEFPSLWPYRHLLGLGVCYMISQSV